MNNVLSTLACFIILGISANTHAEDSMREDRTWADRLEYVSVAVEEPGYHVWCTSPVIGPEGKTHLFVSRWPLKTTFAGWTTDCEIARYVGDTPEGPFEFAEVVLRGTGTDTWDRQSPHNPNVRKVGDSYVLMYIANAGGSLLKQRVASQRIGMMIADSPTGPWRKVGKDGLMLSPPDDTSVWSHGSVVGVNNPALFAHPDGRYFLYYKAMRKGDVRRMGVAIADKIEGPYEFYPDPLTSNDSEIEDGYAFYENGKVYLLTTNNKGGAGYLWESSDGIHFGEPVIGFDKMNQYLPEDLIQNAKTPRAKKFERPQVLLQDGTPTHLYVASGVNLTGGVESCSCVLRIKPPREVSQKPNATAKE
ncbi:hypothetical protein FHS27_004979 [Rhodopirellula rubra]|uniref:Uncharacterized protein n=1 Tax=Aporhodopirellula rubra TaxID=980271 RepID=A0A7W5E2Q7_9BACT|nr:glycoside hydrolase family protein [Aporhodopirellula rubra]MBB3209141.1 hypothetical protein [Aporhodopirellula rubra]